MLNIYSRLQVIVFIKGSSDIIIEESIRRWDLLGPFLILLLQSLFFSINAGKQMQTTFAYIFASGFVFSLIIYANAKLMN